MHPHKHSHAHPHPHHHGSPVRSRRDFLSSLVATAILTPWALGQQRPQTPSETAELYRKISEQYEGEGLLPFKGITTNGDVLPGIFEIKPTGVSTEPVRNAAERFIATLTPLQLSRTMYPVDDVEWRKWMNQHFYARQGVCFAEMTPSAARRRIRTDERIAQRQGF